MLKVALQLMLVADVAAGQQTSGTRVQVLTVCEVLGNMDRYAGAAIVIVGRMESSVSLIDHYEFLSQDHCERPVMTHGHVWSNKIHTGGWFDLLCSVRIAGRTAVVEMMCH